MTLDAATQARIREYVARRYQENPPPPLSRRQRAVISWALSGQPLPPTFTTSATEAPG
jgi:hypothetical protein